MLLRAHPAFDEPTLGTVVDGWFYFVANSQWNKFQGGRVPDAGGVARPVIMRLRLSGQNLHPAERRRCAF